MNNIYSGLASLGFSYLMKKIRNNLTRIILYLKEDMKTEIIIETLLKKYFEHVSQATTFMFEKSRY